MASNDCIKSIAEPERSTDYQSATMIRVFLSHPIKDAQRVVGSRDEKVLCLLSFSQSGRALLLIFGGVELEQTKVGWLAGRVQEDR
jgi:hypothetical protein